MSDELHYTHHCEEHGVWTDTEQYSYCPRCGEDDLEEIPDEAWDAMLEETPADDIQENCLHPAAYEDEDGSMRCYVCGAWL